MPRERSKLFEDVRRSRIESVSDDGLVRLRLPDGSEFTVIVAHGREETVLQPESVQMALDTEGYEVVVARRGLEGMDRLKTMERPCLILLDLAMPVMNGVDFLHAMKAEPALASIPVVVMSAYWHMPPSLTASEFLSKPVGLARLLEVAARFSGGGQR